MAPSQRIITPHIERICDLSQDECQHAQNDEANDGNGNDDIHHTSKAICRSFLLASLLSAILKPWLFHV